MILRMIHCTDNCFLCISKLPFITFKIIVFIDKTKVLMANGSLMKVESMLPLEHSAILLTCIKRKSVLKYQILLFFFEWPLKTGFTVPHSITFFSESFGIILI